MTIFGVQFVDVVIVLKKVGGGCFVLYVQVPLRTAKNEDLSGGQPTSSNLNDVLTNIMGGRSIPKK